MEGGGGGLSELSAFEAPHPQKPSMVGSRTTVPRYCRALWCLPYQVKFDSLLSARVAPPAKGGIKHISTFPFGPVTDKHEGKVLELGIGCFGTRTRTNTIPYGKPVLRGEVGCACVAREVSFERGGMGERGCARRLGEELSVCRGKWRKYVECLMAVSYVDR